MNQVLTIIGFYYLITALWPLVNIRSFEAVSGPKTDKWLVYTVSCLLLGPSILYIYSGLNSPYVSLPILFLAFLNGFLLISIDVIFVLKKVIRKVYLADAAIQVILLIILGIEVAIQ